ncbi:SusD/RagB family nutrient-binding outer membrane lipoprotein [Carboxylicivirga sp. N1Y90]|uniref:SusD/RagB family nutrient-binding outer membrane lipoprotein n=1 Tax=Carboxylicivirga fragile TaxID=3417571 RepID=UPI003D357280|nr:SusD/RagB family nutrient-binding outer membrane lipoprotein [Marinilabiliaceae bacterium N1Y90]
MKKYNVILFVIGLLVLNISCSDDFGDMNTPSDSVTKVEPKFFFNAMQQEVSQNYQRNVNLFSDLYSQYWANTVSGFPSSRYEYVDGWIGNQWREHYTRNVKRAVAMDDMVGADPNYVDAIAIKNIWMCYAWSRMTDMYGDITYFGASTGEDVPYNTQKDIYYDLFKTLDESVNAITGSAEQYVYGEDYDLVFKSDIVKWQKFANSLRLRLAMRISNVDPAKAEAEAKAAVNGPNGLMSSNDDVAKVPLWSKGWFDYLNQMAWNWNNIRMSKTFSNYLYNQSSVGEDPRAPIWFAYQVDGEPKTKEEAGFPIYDGIENGYNLVPSNSDEEFATINLEGGYIDFVGNGAEDGMYVPVMFYSEVLFLQSEAAMRGWIAGDANALYLQGVEASMAYVGVDASAATDYVAGLPSLTGVDESSLKQIITQKWLANFPNGVEAWSDFRRTDYPDITLPKDGVSGSSSVASGKWVKRIRYSDAAHLLNEKNMPADLNTIEKDRMDIKVWWDTADTSTKGSNGLMDSNL